MKTLELYYQEILKENTMKMNKMQKEINEYQKQNKNAEVKIDALRKQATEKATKIEELRAQLLRYEECSLQSVFFTPTKTATDNEIKKLSDLVVKLNERLDIERHNNEELDTSHRKLKEKKKRLERKVVKLEADLEKMKDSRKGSKLSKISLTKDSNDFSAMTSTMTKRKSSTGVIPEKPTESKSSTTTDSPPAPTETIESFDKDELKYKLELTEEKLKIMEDKFKMLEEEKRDDYQYLLDMIQNSKQLFNEALLVLQKEKCICTRHNEC